MSAGPFGYNFASNGTTSERSEKSSQLMIMPAARAIATRCMVWLVEPPVASNATMPLTTTFSSIILPMGIHSLPFPVRRVTWRAAAAVNSWRRGASG
ncbi:hypothetical protein D3C75_783560 [compost metagenome]